MTRVYRRRPQFPHVDEVAIYDRIRGLWLAELSGTNRHRLIGIEAKMRKTSIPHGVRDILAKKYETFFTDCAEREAVPQSWEGTFSPRYRQALQIYDWWRHSC